MMSSSGTREAHPQRAFQVYPAGEEQEVGKRQRKEQQLGEPWGCAFAGESGPKKSDVREQAPLCAVDPEEIAVFVEHQGFQGEFIGEPPFPFRHDGLGRTDKGEDGVIAGEQFSQETIAAVGTWIVSDVVDGAIGGVEGAGGAGEASDDVDAAVLTEGCVDPGDECFEERTRAAFDEECTGEWRSPASMEVSQMAILTRLSGSVGEKTRSARIDKRHLAHYRLLEHLNVIFASQAKRV